MKKSLSIGICFLIASIAFAQNNEVTFEKDGTKVVKGFLTKKDLVTDTSFKWFAENQKGYTPNADAVQAFRQYKDSVNIIAFGGTWCGDTKHILPQFYAIADAAGFSQERITLIGVDRSKKTIQNLSEAFNITNVPTFIIMKNGKEVGRVVEYGSYGLPDKEVGEVIAKAFRK
ncbi:MAG: hypothetical protein C4329_06290 [Chitinophagaceae bacterium]